MTAVLAACLTLAGTPAAQPRTFKIAFYNIRSGMGIQPLGGRPSSFADTVNCDPASGRVNAWGAGIVQAALVKATRNDPLVLALGLAEAWNCASPQTVRGTLRWKADSGERNGVALLARYGFSGTPEFLQLDTSRNKNPRDTMWIVRGAVCLDDGCGGRIDVYATHWSGNGPRAREIYDRQAQQSVEFMAKSAGPHVLVGDLNVFEGDAPVCGQTPNNTSLPILRRAGYVDAWPAVHGRAEGFTGMVNRHGCGQPDGNGSITRGRRTFRRSEWNASASCPPAKLLRPITSASSPNTLARTDRAAGTHPRELPHAVGCALSRTAVSCPHRNCLCW